MSALQITALVSIFVVNDDKTRLTAFCAMGGALILLAVFVLSVRCRVCGEHVMVWAWNRRNTIGDLDRLDGCPQCGAYDDDGSLIDARSAPTQKAKERVALSLDRVRQPPRPAWFVYVIAGIGALWLLRWVMGLLG